MKDLPQSAPVVEGVVPAGPAPSMAQVREIKAANPDCILWYWMGDFYELFFQDAVVASEALGIVLTKRGKHLGEDIPMCGVPIHRADEYLQRLIRRGFRVAVCEQLEEPAEAKKRGSKAVVRRDVVRLVTPGTLTEDTLLDAKARNFLTAVFKLPRPETPGIGVEYAVASLDISTGECEIGLVGERDLQSELARLTPSEILSADDAASDQQLAAWANHNRVAVTPVPAASFDSLVGERLLKAYLGVSDLAAFGAFGRGELAALGALLKYVELTQIGKRPVVRAPRRTGSGSVLVIDASSRHSLELLRSSSGEKSGSLLAAIDRTVTGPGARELAARMASPSTDMTEIVARLDAVAWLMTAELVRNDLRVALRRAPDMARAMSRLSLQRGGPRDLAAVRDALKVAGECRQLLSKQSKPVGLPAALQACMEQLAAAGEQLHGRLGAALVDEPPPFRRDGGFVRQGFSKDIDEARRLREDSRQVMAALEVKYVEQSGVKSLKIRHNNILGYYIEVGAIAAKPLMGPPLSETFRHRQTMASAVRFTTDELVEIEGKIASAGERAVNLEQDVFNDLVNALLAHERVLTAVAAGLAALDCDAGLAEIAVEQGYVRPELIGGTSFEIKGGRHPVVEQSLMAARKGPFIENDCVLGRAQDTAIPGFEETAAGRIWLVTGPNMAGKSTFLRQNALIVVLAQMGSFVPAKSARIGVVDRLFSRVGASDDIARGRSTFMVEMVETAAILNQATDRSLVILDEVGRGTATFDGLSIAWATVEYLHAVSKCRVLFATHYHEMTALAGKLTEVSNVTIDVKEWHDDIVFLHKVKPGAADRSYGIQVAKLAGLPGPVVKRAGEVLKVLEKTERRSGGPNALDDLPLFAAARPQGHVPGGAAPSPVETALAALNPDNLTPKGALDALYRLKALQAEPRKP